MRFSMRSRRFTIASIPNWRGSASVRMLRTKVSRGDGAYGSRVVGGAISRLPAVIATTTSSPPPRAAARLAFGERFSHPARKLIGV